MSLWAGWATPKYAAGRLAGMGQYRGVHAVVLYRIALPVLIRGLVLLRRMIRSEIDMATTGYKAPTPVIFAYPGSPAQVFVSANLRF